ncbi:MAG: CDP-alcohol phosphatidyltransferase family protein [Actinomycetota bacterium]|nr:CDP-alcohol phosphatidyltransferase family protein [Actinomycetota bacterium]
MRAEAAPSPTPPGAKKRDYWWTVLATDPVAVPLAGFLARRRWLTPDQVTALALVSGLSVGAAFATGTRAGLVAGGILFYLAFLFDCVDGKLARALGVTSEKGEALDHLADGGRRASASLGLALWTWRSDAVPNDRVLWVVVYAVLAYYFVEISGAEKGEPAGGVAGRVSGALAKRRLLPNPGMPDVQAVVFIIGPITGLVVPALGAGIAMVTAAILLTVWRRLR